MAFTLKQATLLALIAQLVLFNVVRSRDFPTIDIQSSTTCDPKSHPLYDQFWHNVAYVLADLLTQTPIHFDYHNNSPYVPNSPTAYGHGYCNKNKLKPAECTNCLLAAKGELDRQCNNRNGGRAVLENCYLHFEQFPIKNN